MTGAPGQSLPIDPPAPRPCSPAPHRACSHLPRLSDRPEAGYSSLHSFLFGCAYYTRFPPSLSTQMCGHTAETPTAWAQIRVEVAKSTKIVIKAASFGAAFFHRKRKNGTVRTEIHRRIPVISMCPPGKFQEVFCALYETYARTFSAKP